jgi:hypothetical protein
VQAAGLDRLPGVTFFALSDSVAEPLRRLNPVAIRTAVRPDGEAMLALLAAAG